MVFSGPMILVGYAARVEQKPTCLTLVVSVFAVLPLSGRFLEMSRPLRLIAVVFSWTRLPGAGPFGSIPLLVVIVFFKTLIRHALALIEKFREVDIEPVHA
ncbi:hypothetical protein EMCG_02467 [[Emmonsia] crescens]|uniref:Uncharacterized protein n=1 Tax=[Emmonsia] crescens TaxID=73230 RepID=A0A0G2J911_9EURO|nr:hypothetical protein EMCG_02467 [Emmonsia crescens UAMH 3008]